MALQASNGTDDVILVNIYAPTDRVAKEDLFLKLKAIPIPTGKQVFVGGDLNCTLHGLVNRSSLSTALDHDSPGLRRLLIKWRLQVLPLQVLPSGNDSAALAHFNDAHHTYHYSVRGHGLASSRLDRWYANDQGRLWLAATELDKYGIEGDHKGVLLHLCSTDNPVRCSKFPRVFPAPSYARKRVDKFSISAITDFALAIITSLASGADAALL
uniref:Endonuclease/exonuclease/phosphatase domain-containing protein n=1 Tax=Hyaloperonospora arabidopsidis (strain Emoy2) TaxID=559515 RepID=M4B565_HYAAE